MNKELTLTAFRRVHYLEQAVTSWNQATNILDWPVSYSLEPSNPVVEAAMIRAFNKFECGGLTGIVNDQRLGVLRNPHATLTAAFDYGNDFVVLAEDDIVVSDDILEYFEWAMEKYKGDQSVLAVLAFSRNDGSEGPPDPAQVSRTGSFCPLVWGTWVDRWNKYIEPTWDLDYTSGNPDGSEAGWDWNLNRVAAKNELSFIYPRASRSDHIGQYDGTHMIPSDFEASRAPTFKDTHNRGRDFFEA